MLGSNDKAAELITLAHYGSQINAHGLFISPVTRPPHRRVNNY